LPNEPVIRGANVLQTTVPYLVYNLLAKDDMCRGIVSIDSSLPHITAGLTKAVVIWAHSTDRSFGYDYNKNILQDCRRDDILYFTALGASGARVDYIKPQTLLKEVDEYLYDTQEDNE
jgi:ADP-heptose:LPS heptosyltransferase